MTSVSTTGPGPAKLPWWTPGDWNAFFGFGTNILVNVLVLTGLLRFVLKLPDPIIFGRILPAVGLMLFLSTVYYAHLARKLAIRSEAHTSELQSLMRTSYAVFCLKKKNNN